MEIIGFLTFIIACELWRLGNIIEHKGTPTTDVSGVENELEKIFQILGGEEKLEESQNKRRADLETRLIKALTAQGKKPTKDEVDKIFEHAGFNATPHNLPYKYKFATIEKWVEWAEKEVRNNERYGGLLEKAREYISGKAEIKDLNEVQIALSTDYWGAKWLIEQLVSEKKLEEVKKWNSETESHEVVSWKVINKQA